MSKSKLEIKSQYGGRPFSETVSSNTPVVHWDILSKFVAQLDFIIAKRVPKLKPKPKVEF